MHKLICAVTFCFESLETRLRIKVVFRFLDQYNQARFHLRRGFYLCSIDYALLKGNNGVVQSEGTQFASI